MRNRIKYYVKWRETVLVSKEELTLQELKNIEFDLLKEFDAFCRQNQIRYFLAYGTLLGAVRYKGFIPWDDDVDVLVPREDYDKMIKIYKDSDRYRLYSTERNPKFGYPFSKLCDMTTKKEEENINNGIEQGVEQGLKQGLEQGKFDTISNLDNTGSLSLDVAAKELGLTNEEFLSKLNNNK